MAGSSDKKVPLIIKKIEEEAEGGHHGGAWKVAYADFVTAMMAFFLLLWLLGSTTSEKRRGIADYFSGVAVSKAESGAGGVLGGVTVGVSGPLVNRDAEIRPPAPVREAPNLPNLPDVADGDPTARAAADLGELERQKEQEEQREFKEAADAIRQAIQSNPELQPLAKNLMIDQTPEGMRIQIVDQEGQSMFPLGGAQMYDPMRKLLRLVVKAVGPLPNKVSIRGHTDATPYANDPNGNWDLSAQRANATLRTMIGAGLAARQVQDVVGKADIDPLFPQNPLDPRNRRMSIILLKQVAHTGP
jgi:chemotaxis protein MotB